MACTALARDGSPHEAIGGGSHMAGKVNTEWFGVYRNAESELIEAVKNGQNRSTATREILIRLNNSRAEAGKKGLQEQSFARILKAGRFLDSLGTLASPEQVQCGYVQIELLERISRLSSEVAQELLPAVLRNELSVDAMTQRLALMQSQDPLTSSLVTRNSIRQLGNRHERLSTKALLNEGAAFFGAAEGKICKQEGAHSAVTPSFVVIQGEQVVAGIFTRLGSQSKQPLAAAFELYFLAQSHRPYCRNVWLLFPEKSLISDHLAFLAWSLGGAPTKGDWLHLGFVDEDRIDPLPKHGYLGAEARYYADYHTDDDAFNLSLKDLSTGERMSLHCFRYAQDDSTRS